MSLVSKPELADAREMLEPAPAVVTFEEWWDMHGSAMRPHRGADHEEHGKRIAAAAWNMAATFGKPMDLSSVTIYEAPPGMVMVPEPASTCVWSRYSDDDEGTLWEGACGSDFNFTDGDPIYNEMTYCPKCGGLVEVAEEDDN